MTNKQKVFGLLGLAAKAGKISEVRLGVSCHRLGGSIGEHEKNVPEYVYLL